MPARRDEAKKVISLAEAVCLNASTGVLTWRRRGREHFSSDRIWRLWNHRFAEKEVGVEDLSTGYLVFRFSGKRYYVHHVVYALAIGPKTSTRIDHKNRNKKDNRPSNLRAATQGQNRINAAVLDRRNTSGVNGVFWNKQAKGWTARIGHGGKDVYLGTHKTLSKAAEARRKAEVSLYGEFSPLKRK